MVDTIKLSEKNKDFFDQVFEVVKLIPKGRVCSYGVIAAYLGAKRGARMVGWAMNAAHSRPEVPADRGVNAEGLMTGKMDIAATELMQERLEEEGIAVRKDEVQQFTDVLWDTMIELAL